MEESRLIDLIPGFFYKLRNAIILDADHQGFGTVQEDIDRIHNDYYEFIDYNEDDGAHFKIPTNDPKGPIQGENGERYEIFLNAEILYDLAQGDDTIFVETTTINIHNQANSTIYGGKRNRKQRKTKKQKRKSRKQKKRMTRRR